MLVGDQRQFTERAAVEAPRPLNDGFDVFKVHFASSPSLSNPRPPREALNSGEAKERSCQKTPDL
jgi:hypothetical protein